MKIDIGETQPFIDRIETMIMEYGRSKGRLEASRQTFRRLAARPGAGGRCCRSTMRGSMNAPTPTNSMRDSTG